MQQLLRKENVKKKSDRGEANKQQLERYFLLFLS
jgi:hypothetical protein